MTDATHDPLNEDTVLAGELALRVLSPVDEAAARARAEADPVFAAEVDGWNESLAALAEGVVVVSPSGTLWPRIEAGLTPVAANDNGRLAFWRRWAIGSTGLLAASLAAVIVLMAQPSPAPQVVSAPPAAAITRVATLTLEGGAAAMTLAYDAQTGNLYLSPTKEMAGDERVPHLWLVMPEGGVQLVGAIDGTATSRRSLDSVKAGMAGQALQVAVSMEAPGHTPGATKPDGPVVASGEFQQL